MTPHQVWSAALAGMARGDGTVELLDRDCGIRAPQSNCRRIGFIGQAFPEQGFLAGWVADRLARRRDGAVLAAHGCPGPAGILFTAGVADAAPSSVPATSRTVPFRASSRAEACAGLARAESGLFGMSLDLDRDPTEPPTRVWHRQIGPGARFFDAVVTDWGMPLSWPEVEAIRAGSRALCVVVRAEPDAVDLAAALLRSRSLAGNPADRTAPGQNRLSIALVGPHAQSRGLADRLRHQLPAGLPTAFHTVTLPADRTGRRLSRETRFALLDLTARLMSA